VFHWKSVLAATDFSPLGDGAVSTGASIAKAGGGTLSIVYVADPPPPYSQPLLDRIGPADPDELWTRRARRSMASLLERLRPELPDARGFVRVGTPWREIVRLAGELGADGIVVGSVGHSAIERLLLGSTAEGVVRNASRPVLVVRNGPLTRVRRVLLPVDMDEGSKTSVRYALRKLPKDLELAAVHAVAFPRMIDPELANVLPDEAESSRRLRAFLDDLGGKRIASSVVLGEPAAGILDASGDADLVFIAPRGRQGLARALRASVAQTVVRHSQGPVLVLPGPRARARGKRPQGALPGEVLVGAEPQPGSAQ
jgi:nucleotide-binding universal stress UspA family protein